MIDLTDPATVQDPYPAYARLREHAPVYFWETASHDQGGMWLVSRYADVRTLLADDRITKRGENVGRADELPRILLFLDPPEHTVRRKPATQTFTKRRVEQLRAEAETEVEQLAAPLLAGETVEVIDGLATPLPVRTILRLLGVPLEHSAYVRDVSRRILETGDLSVMAAAARDGQSAEDMAAATVQAERESEAFMLDQVVAARDEGRGGLLSALLAASEEDPDAALVETARMGVQLLVNGQDSTVNLIGTALLHLLRNRDQWERLVANPDLAERAVEECLRFDSPTQRGSARWATSDLEVDGVTIPAGSQIGLLIASANRDAAVFEDPDRFDITRDPNPHLAFGHGRHHCPGAALTRMEVAVLLRHLATQAPDLAIVDSDVRFRATTADRGIEAMTIARTG